jgi:hypothetical protein
MAMIAVALMVVPATVPMSVIVTLPCVSTPTAFALFATLVVVITRLGIVIGRIIGPGCQSEGCTQVRVLSQSGLHGLRPFGRAQLYAHSSLAAGVRLGSGRNYLGPWGSGEKIE